MKRYTLELLLRQGNVTTEIDMPVTPDGAMSTTDIEQAKNAMTWWKSAHPKEEFQLTEWTSRLVL